MSATFTADVTGARVLVDAPRTIVHEGADVHVPWYVRFDQSGVQVQVYTRDPADLIRLRDAITAALDEHGDQS